MKTSLGEERFTDRDRERAAAAPRRARALIAHPATSDRDYTDDEFEFLQAIEAYKAKHNVRFLTNCTYLAILKSLGYRKTPPFPESI